MPESLQNRGAKFKKDLQDKVSEQGVCEDVATTRVLVVIWLAKELEEDKVYKCVKVITV